MPTSGSWGLNFSLPKLYLIVVVSKLPNFKSWVSPIGKLHKVKNSHLKIIRNLLVVKNYHRIFPWGFFNYEFLKRRELTLKFGSYAYNRIKLIKFGPSPLKWALFGVHFLKFLLLHYVPLQWVVNMLFKNMHCSLVKRTAHVLLQWVVNSYGIIVLLSTRQVDSTCCTVAVSSKYVINIEHVLFTCLLNKWTAHFGLMQ